MMTIAADILYQPALAPLHILAILIVLTALALAAYARTVAKRPLRSSLLCAMRLIVIAALGVLLLGPSVQPESSTKEVRPRMNILLDTSGSMLTADVDNQTRLRAAIDHWLTPDKIEALGETFDVHLHSFAEQARSLPAAALNQPDTELTRDQATHYARSITDVLLDGPRSGEGRTMLVVGDGHDSDDRPLGSAIMLAKNRNVTIHTVAAGSDHQPRDLALIALPTQEYLMAGESGGIVTKVYASGIDTGSATVTLQHGGRTEQRVVRFDGNQSATLDWPILHEQPGTYEYTLRVEPVSSEPVVQNNRASVFIDVTKRRLSVLLLEGEPFWDTKFIAQSLRSDPRIELTQITQVAEGRRQSIVTRREDGQAALPTTLDQMAQYDVIILGRGLGMLYSPQELKLLTEYVAEGRGHVIFARGRAYDVETPAGRDAAEALKVIEPVTWQRGLMRDLPLHLTASGRSHAAFSFPGIAAESGDVVEALPRLGVMPGIDQAKAATIVLAEAGRGPAAKPAIVTMNYGRGRVFAVLGEGLWRWGFLPPELRQYDGVYDALWSNTVRWLAMGSAFEPGEQVAMQLSRSSVRAGDAITIDVRTRYQPPGNFAPMLTATDADGNTQRLDLQPVAGQGTQYTATLTPQALGVWNVTLNAPLLADKPLTEKFNVYELDLERLRSAARPGVLSDLASSTGGMNFNVTDSVDLADKLMRQRASQVTPPRPRYVWDHGAWLALLVVWMGLEWIGRRQSGML